MTKAEIRQAIKEIVEDNGFIIRDTNYSLVGFEIVDGFDIHLVNFTITESMANIDYEHHLAQIKLVVRASIASMGGTPTGDELVKAGRIITKAGALVKALNQMNLTYTQTW